MTGMAAGNIFGQISLFWSKIAPYNSREGVVKEMVVGISGRRTEIGIFEKITN